MSIYAWGLSKNPIITIRKVFTTRHGLSYYYNEKILPQIEWQRWHSLQAFISNAPQSCFGTPGPPKLVHNFKLTILSTHSNVLAILMVRGCRNKIASPYESEPQNNLQTIPLNTVFLCFLHLLINEPE